MSEDNKEYSGVELPQWPGKEPVLVAKKDHVICQNEHFFDIKKGDELSDIPEHFIQTLKTEGVI